VLLQRMVMMMVLAFRSMMSHLHRKVTVFVSLTISYSSVFKTFYRKGTLWSVYIASGTSCSGTMVCSIPNRRKHHLPTGCPKNDPLCSFAKISITNGTFSAEFYTHMLTIIGV